MTIRPIIAALALAFLPATPLPAAAESGCISCHTSDSAIKALFAPPKGAPSEGEG